MSVEISGPKGYDYQYMVSLLAALEYLDNDDTEIYIEKKNEEDAQILFTKDGIKYTVDIQAKSKSNNIGIEEFSNWISHFESNSSDRSLLNKIEEDENRVVLFISNERCKDDASLFVDDGINEYPLKSSLNNDFINKIRQNINLHYDKSKTDLEIFRKIFINNYLSNIKNNKLRNILTRFKINERYTDEVTYDKISRILNKKYHVPQSMTTKTILELNEVIKNGRGTCTSITNDLLNVIRKYSCKTILNKDENYIERIEKNVCCDILEKENVLLLTGVSLSGKTYLASDIAQDYLGKGYNVKTKGELYGESGAISFINHGDIEDRLLILEDPFGDVETKDNAIDILSKVENLVSKSKANRKIIITSRIDIVLDTMSKSCITKCCIGGKEWMDLTCKEADQVSELWTRYFGTSYECNQIYNNMNKWLVKNEKITSLQLGHIAKIYNSGKNIKELNSQEIIKVARRDSDYLANVIEKRGAVASKVFIALGVSCNTYRSINLSDLAFILSDYEEYPGLNKSINNGISFSLKEKSTTEYFPKYNHIDNIDNNYKNELKYLVRHGYIEIDNLKRIRFVHPIYHYATKILYKKQFTDEFEQDDVIKITEKILGCLSVNANLCALNMVEDMYTEEKNEELKKLILKSLNTIFPSVRDKIIMFFDKRINDLDIDEQLYFIDVLRYRDNIKNGGVLWHEGIPWFNPSNYRSFSDYANGTDEDKTKLLLSKVNSSNEISSEEMWTMLNYNKQNKLTIDVLEKALSYDESFIREIAIRSIFKYYAFNFDMKTIGSFLDRYEHPNYIYNLFRGALDSWMKYKDNCKKIILEYFKESLDLMSVSMRSKEFLENFEDEHFRDGIEWNKINKYSDRIILWNVWHEIFIEFLNKFPSKYNIEMNEPHMVLVTNKSLKYINSNIKIVELATAWFNWLNRYLEYNLPDDYGMSVANYLMNGTRRNYANRKELFRLMISLNKTNLITTNEKVFIDNWEFLSNEEKSLILDLLFSDRQDIKWIQAVALNRKNIPKEIQIKLIGKIINESNISEFVDILISQNILEQCLNIHCGYPEPLGMNGYSHGNCRIWDYVIVEVLKRDPFNRAFDIALHEIINLLYNKNEERITNIYEIYANILLKDKEKRKLVFERLFYATVSTNQCNKKVWDMLFQESSEEEKNHYFDRISEDIELIQRFQDKKDDILELFDESVVFKEIYPRLKIDYVIMKLLEIAELKYMLLEEERKQYENNIPKLTKLADGITAFNNNLLEFVNEQIEKLQKDTLNSLINEYIDDPPRLRVTTKLVKYYTSKLCIKSDELNGLIEKNRKRLITVASENRNKYTDYYDLENWIF